MIRGKAVKQLEEEVKRKELGDPWEETAMALSDDVSLRTSSRGKGSHFLMKKPTARGCITA
jgi:hypothetical protein